MSKRTSELAEMKHFARVLKMVWPHWRYVLIAVFATIGVALCYTFSLASLYPILKILVEKESIHDIADKFVVEQRLGIGITVRDTKGLLIADKLGIEALQIVEIREKHQLYKQGVRSGDFIFSVDDKKLSGWEIVRYLANAPEEQQLTLKIYPAGGGELKSVHAKLKKLKWSGKAILQIVSYIPREKEKMTLKELSHRRMIMLAYVLGFVIFINIIGNICRFIGQYYGSIVGARTLLDLRRHMYGKVMVLPMSFFITRGVSDTMSRFMQDCQDVLKALRTVFGKVLREPMKAIGAFTVLIYFAPKVTLLLVIITPIAAVLFRKFGRWVRRANEKLLKGYGRLLGALEKTLSGIKVVKAYTMENRERIRYFQVERDILRQSLKIEKVNAMNSPTLEVLGIIGACAGVLWITSQVMSEKLDSAVLGTLLLAMGAILDPIRKLSNVYTAIQRANAGAKRIFEIIDMPSEYELSKGTKVASAPEKNIRFDNVTFTYPNSSYPAVNNVSVEIKAGEIVAIVGPNGSGKSTFVSLLLRLFDPQAGQILWDDIDIKELKLRSLRQQIAYVSQETVIFADTVRNNIAYGNPKASLEEIKSAARQAHADEFIERMPQGYDTILGEHGVTLSGGERQRLAIARAILKNAPVLIFDEATSQIDADSEQKIQDAMDHFMPGRTSLVIAHRFSTIGKANKVLVMDRGKLVAFGNHRELIESCELYRSLYQTQLHGLQTNE